MAIDFTQFLLPRGERRKTSIERPAEIEALADKFIAVGGWFECEVLTTGHASLTACMDRDDGDNDIEIEVVPNGPGIGEAVDRLVQRAVKHVDALSRARNP